MGDLMEVSDFLGPYQAMSHHSTVPDVRGLFYKECMLVIGRRGLRINVVRLTEHPMPVDGLMVGQSPDPQAQVERNSHLIVQVWHPPQARP